MKRRLNWDGIRFGMLVVIGEYQKSSVLCECDCGNRKRIRTSNLKTGNTSSCGCIKSNMLVERNTKHKKARTEEHKIWIGMRQRCCNPKNKKYKDYGGRGIKICERWTESFVHFLADMGKRPSKNHSIDRIDVNGNYEPSNCRWATTEEQASNRRKKTNTGIVGVRFNKRKNKFNAYITVNKKMVWLGTFSREFDAVHARQRAEQNYWSNT